MIYLKRAGWHLPESAATDEQVYLNRRQWLKKMGIGGIASGAIASGMLYSQVAHADASLNPWKDLYPVKNNPKYKAERELTAERYATTYNNFYEFGSHKSIANSAQKLRISPWQVRIEGLVEKPMTVDFDKLVRQMPLEERILRHRCVEAWAMTVPWSGFEMKHLVKFAKPLSSARYISFETLADGETMPGISQPWHPWPYLEGVTVEEAMNELCFIATGLYGKPIPKQNGAPLRLVLPWKYGFKSIKSIVRIQFTKDRPVSFWEESAPKEYGFWANVNPEVPHRRWSQASERLLGSNGRVPTRLYNGYGKYVAGLYANMPSDARLFM